MTEQQQRNADIAKSVEHALNQAWIVASGWEAKAHQMEDQCKTHRATIDRLERQLAELTQLVGAETPIAAFDLATTWRAEKAAYQQELAELRASAKIAVDRWRHVEQERRTYRDAHHAADTQLADASRQLAELRATADQAISNLRGIKALRDDPHIEEMIDATADLLGEASQ